MVQKSKLFILTRRTISVLKTLSFQAILIILFGLPSIYIVSNDHGYGHINWIVYYNVPKLDTQVHLDITNNVAK